MLMIGVTWKEYDSTNGERGIWERGKHIVRTNHCSRDFVIPQTTGRNGRWDIMENCEKGKAFCRLWDSVQVYKNNSRKSDGSTN